MTPEKQAKMSQIKYESQDKHACRNNQNKRNSFPSIKKPTNPSSKSWLLQIAINPVKNVECAICSANEQHDL